MNSMEDNICLIDTNILIYYYDITDQQKHTIAKHLIDACWKKEKNYALTAQTLAEFFVITTRKIENKLSVEQAESIIEDIVSFSQWKIFSYDHSTILKAVSLYKKNKRHFWDALIAATMIQNTISTIYTENITDFEQIELIKPINPFAH